MCHELSEFVKIDLINKNIKMSSFKSSENIQKKEDGPDRSVSDNQSSSVTLSELAMKARKDTVSSKNTVWLHFLWTIHIWLIKVSH